MSWNRLAAAAMLAVIAATPPLAAAPAPEIPIAPTAPRVAQSGEAGPSLTDLVALTADRYRRLTVPVTIQGQGPFQFMIDTGAQATVITRTLADRLGLGDRQLATLVGMASRRETEIVDIADLQLGSRNFYIQTAPLVEADHIGGADGILGLDSLQNQRVLFDFAAASLHVADAEEQENNRGFDIVVKARERLGQLIITEAMLDGVRVAVIVDTGAQNSLGNPELGRRLRRAPSLGHISMTDVNGQDLVGDVRQAGELALQSARLRNFAIMFADSPVFKALGLNDRPTLVLGMAELQVFKRVAIDFRTRRVLFDLPSKAEQADPQWRSRFGH
ncbi:MAG: aspartyl protease family protein [Croceibacterium sp.]